MKKKYRVWIVDQYSGAVNFFYASFFKGNKIELL